MYFTDISDETIREIISPPEAALPCPPLEGVGGGIERMVLFVQEAEQSTPLFPRQRGPEKRSPTLKV